VTPLARRAVLLWSYN